MSTEGEVRCSSTYDWLSTNPLAASCGGALCSLYSASKNYNSVTNWTFGSVEGVVGYAADKAKPIVGMVSGTLEKPMETVDSYVAGGLRKLESKYPVISRPPAEIADEGAKLVSSALQSSQERIGNTRAGSLLGYGVDATLSMTEGLVEKVLPPPSDSEATIEKVVVTDDDPPAVNKKSWFGLRKRKINAKEPQQEQDAPASIEPVYSRSARVCNISYTVYYRSLAKVQSLQQQVYVYLKRLKTSLNILQYAQSISTGVDKQRHNVAQALHDAESKIREYLSCKKSQVTSNEEFASWLSDGKDDEDINWLLRSNAKKDLFHLALDYAKSVSEKVLETLRSLSGVTGYLPTRLHEGVNNAVQQAQDVYQTLKLNNVPAELPSFLLTQIVEIVETQLVFCKKIGNYISSSLKTRFGHVPVQEDNASETSSQGVSEVRLDLDEEDEGNAEEK